MKPSGESFLEQTQSRRLGVDVKEATRLLMTHKCRGSIIVLSISKIVEPSEEQKEMISGFQQGILYKH